MNRDLAREILDLNEQIETFQEPAEKLSDRQAERLWEAQEKRRAQLDALCLDALREMMLEAARAEWAVLR